MYRKNGGMESRAPWDVGRPQPSIQALVEAGGFTGQVLDVGSGYGENALCIAAAGLHVTGFEKDQEALDWSIEEAMRRGLQKQTRFVRFDLRELLSLRGSTVYDTVLDSLVFHAYRDPERRSQHVAGLRALTGPGGRLHLLCYSDQHVGPPDPPHTVSLAEITEAFADGWTVEEARETTTISNLAPNGVTSWLVTLIRDRGES